MEMGRSGWESGHLIRATSRLRKLTQPKPLTSIAAAIGESDRAREAETEKNATRPIMTWRVMFAKARSSPRSFIEELSGFGDEGGEGGECPHESDQQNGSEFRTDRGALHGNRPDQAEEEAAEDIDSPGRPWKSGAAPAVNRGGEAVASERAACAGKGDPEQLRSHDTGPF